MVYSARVPEVVDDRFRHNMRQFRERSGMTQGELSRRLIDWGWKVFHQTTISRIEAGERPVRLSEALVIAEALDARLEDLVAESPGVEFIESLNSAADQLEAAIKEHEHTRELVVSEWNSLATLIESAQRSARVNAWPEVELIERYLLAHERATAALEKARTLIERLGEETAEDREHIIREGEAERTPREGFDDVDRAAHLLYEDHKEKDDAWRKAALLEAEQQAEEDNATADVLDRMRGDTDAQEE